MRVLILGGYGMLGHVLWRTFRVRFDTYVTVRAERPDLLPLAPSDRTRLLAGVDATDVTTVATAIGHVKPAVVVNAIGVVKQRPEAEDPVTAITVNSLFPHQVARLCAGAGARLVHISTDCVYSGRRGRYREDDVPDPEDLYGRSKLLGEVTGPGCLTLRTSIIGRELVGATGLVEWFLAARGGRVKGYANAVFSGLTAASLASIIGDLLEREPPMSGLFHLAAAPISKLDLLRRLRVVLDLPIEIEPYLEFRCDRSLDGSRLEAEGGVRPPSWDTMIEALGRDHGWYEERRAGASSAPTTSPAV